MLFQIKIISEITAKEMSLVYRIYLPEQFNVGREITGKTVTNYYPFKRFHQVTNMFICGNKNQKIFKIEKIHYIGKDILRERLEHWLEKCLN